MTEKTLHKECVSQSMPQLPDPDNLKSKKFYPDEKYHYLDNNERIEEELKDFKVEIERKFESSSLSNYQYQRNSKLSDSYEQTPPSTHRSKQMINYATLQPPKSSREVATKRPLEFNPFHLLNEFSQIPHSG